LPGTFTLLPILSLSLSRSLSSSGSSNPRSPGTNPNINVDILGCSTRCRRVRHRGTTKGEPYGKDSDSKGPTGKTPQQCYDDYNARLTRREAEIGRELSRLIDSIAKGVPAEAIAGRIRELNDERTATAHAINQSQEGENVVALHSAAIERYKRDVADLAEALKTGDSDGNAGVYARVRDLVSAIVVHAKPSEPGIKIDIKGRLAALCGSDIFPNYAGITPRKVSGDRW
jgi:hypothetical protein